MKKLFSERKPVIASVLWALLILVFYTLGGVATAITKAGEVTSLFTNGIFVLAASLTALLYIKLSDADFSVYGLKAMEKKCYKKVLFYLPAILIEGLGLLVGFRGLTRKQVSLRMFFAVALSDYLLLSG
jgi:hypothetical protein